MVITDHDAGDEHCPAAGSVEGEAMISGVCRVGVVRPDVLAMNDLGTAEGAD